MFLKILILLTLIGWIDAKPYVNSRRLSYGEHMNWRFGGWKPILSYYPEDQQQQPSFQTLTHYTQPTEISNPIQSTPITEYSTSIQHTSPIALYETSSQDYSSSGYTVHSIEPLSTHTVTLPHSNITFDKIPQLASLTVADIPNLSSGHYNVGVKPIEVSSLQALNILEQLKSQTEEPKSQYVSKSYKKQSSPTPTLSPKESNWKYITVPVAVETEHDKVLNQNDIKDIEKEVLKVIPEVDHGTVVSALREGAELLEIDENYKPLKFNLQGKAVNVISGHAPVFKYEDKRKISDILKPLLLKLRHPAVYYPSVVDPQNVNLVHLSAGRYNLPSVLHVDQLLKPKSNAQSSPKPPSKPQHSYSFHQKLNHFIRPFGGPFRLPSFIRHRPLHSHPHNPYHGRSPSNHNYHQSNPKLYHSHRRPQLPNQLFHRPQNYAQNYFKLLEKNAGGHKYSGNKLGLIQSFIKPEHVQPVRTIELPKGFEVSKEHLLDHPLQISKPEIDYSTPPSPSPPSPSLSSPPSSQSAYSHGHVSGPTVPAVTYVSENSQSSVITDYQLPVTNDYNLHNQQSNEGHSYSHDHYQGNPDYDNDGQSPHSSYASSSYQGNSNQNEYGSSNSHNQNYDYTKHQSANITVYEPVQQDPYYVVNQNRYNQSNSDPQKNEQTQYLHPFFDDEPIVTSSYFNKPNSEATLTYYTNQPNAHQYANDGTKNNHIVNQYEPTSMHLSSNEQYEVPVSSNQYDNAQEAQIEYGGYDNQNNDYSKYSLEPKIELLNGQIANFSPANLSHLEAQALLDILNFPSYSHAAHYQYSDKLEEETENQASSSKVNYNIAPKPEERAEEDENKSEEDTKAGDIDNKFTSSNEEVSFGERLQNEESDYDKLDYNPNKNDKNEQVMYSHFINNGHSEVKSLNKR